MSRLLSARSLRRAPLAVISSALALGGLAATFAISFTGSSDPYERVAHLLPRASFERASEIHQQMLLEAVADPTPHDVQLCFAPDAKVDQAFIDAFNLAIQGGNPLTAQTGNRWGSTATNPGPLNRGDPTTITYSFVPDGVTIPGDGIGPTAPNDLNSTFNGLFGGPAMWQQFWHDAFAAWGEQIGITYVFEPNDDGAPIFVSPGVLGVRGDVRIAGRFIDGGSGVLAFNNFPNNGDMIMDTADTAGWGNPANNFRFLRNVILHEHGHGMGLFHVCPIDATKLMEPFLQTSFDGIQLDDTIGGNRLYGDRLEPNDSTADAENLGVLPTSTLTIDTLSIDGTSDEDWFEFFLGQPRDLSVTVTPTGSSYPEGPQVGACNTGTTFDSLRVRDLGFEVRDAAGNVVFGSNGAGLGQPESVLAFPVSATGSYFIRVFGTGTDNTQMYELSVSNAPFTVPPFTITLPRGAPENLTPDAVTIVDVSTINGLSSPNRAAATLRVSANGGPFTSVPLVDLGGSNGFQGALPSLPPLSELDWYVSIPPASGGSPLTLPFGAPANGTFHSVYDGNFLVPVFADDFETDQGWTVTNTPTLTGGAWQRAIPSGGGARSDPAFDADGSGFCYVTQDGGGNTDVDGGSTTLTSPAIDLSAFSEAVIRLQFWYRNDFGAAPNQDTFEIEIDLGTGFFPLESYNNNVNAWLSRSFSLPLAPSTTAFRLRFVAEDLDPGSVIEAGVDAIEILGVNPLPMLGATCQTGSAGAGGEDVFRVNGSTGGPLRRVELEAGQAIQMSMASPSTVGPSGALWVMLAALGVPDPSTSVPVPMIGELCIPLPAIAIGPLFAGPSPTPWATTFLNGLGTPDVLTLQAVLFETAMDLRVSNTVTLSVR